MLYLVDKPMAGIAVRTAAGDDDAHVALLQDGVLLDPGSEPLADLDATLYAVRRDAEVRGVDLPPEVEVVSYDTLMQMVFEHEIKSFV